MYTRRLTCTKNVPDDIIDWLDEFDTFSIYKIFPETYELWIRNQETMAESKKKLERVAAK